MTTLSELKELCEKATRGSWAAGRWSGICYEEHSHGGGHCNYQYKLIRDSDISHHSIVLENEPIYLVKTTEEYGAMSNNNAKFIAATDPETVLKLIETIEKQREALELAKKDAISVGMLGTVEGIEKALAEFDKKWGRE